MSEATLPITTYNPAGINVFPAPVVDLFRYENIYKNTNGDFAVEYRKQIIELRDQGHKLREIAEKLNCSVSVVKKWLRRNREGDLISDKPRAPLHRDVKNTQYNQYLVGEILKEFPFYGSRRIAHEIEKRYGEIISYRTVVTIMKDIAEKKEVVIPERIEVDEVDAIWHMDMTQMRIAKGRKQFIFAIIDACSRRVLAIKSYDHATASAAVDCLCTALDNNGGRKCRILYTDNGRMFIASTFEAFLRQRVIFHHRVDKGSPWQNGKVERLFGTLFREWIAYRRYMIPESLSDSLEEFRQWFNNEREIQKLGYRTPMQIMEEKEKVYAVGVGIK
jgi:transposase InsO family protein